MKDMKTTVKVGHIVYSEMSWSHNIIRAKVTEIRPEGVMFDLQCTVNENGQSIDREYGSAGATWDNLYPTAKAAYEGRKAKNDAQVAKFCKEIATIEDLVKFPLTHCINGEEYTDWQAVKAYKIRAKELLGVDL